MFISFVIGVVLATVLFYQRATLPSIEMMGVMAVVTLALFGFKRYWWPYKTGHFYLGLIIGFQLAFWHSFFQPKLPDTVQAILQQQGKIGHINLWVEGEVTGLPQVYQDATKGQKVKLMLKLTSLEGMPCEHQNPKVCEKFAFFQNPQSRWQFSAFSRPLVALADYHPDQIPHAGEVWRLPVRMKPVHGLLNPGGFDFEANQLLKGVVARGYVLHKTGMGAEKLAESPGWSVDVWREALREHWQQQFEKSPFVGIYLALLLGDRSGLTTEQWQLFQQTGTVHLMAISGLHIGLAAGLGALLFGGVWWLGVRLMKPKRWLHAVPKQQYQAVGALLFATLYAALSGFGIPAQRAWLMVVAMVLVVWLRRPFQPWSALALAALLVLFWQPASVLSAGFWLSFVAVALIFATLFHPKVKLLKHWQKGLLIQGVLTVGLLPLLAFYFHQLPVNAFLANVIAVPAVSFIGLPLLVLAALVPAEWSLWLNEQFWQVLWHGLSELAQWHPPVTVGGVTVWQLVAVEGLIFFGLLRAVDFKTWGRILFLIVLLVTLPKMLSDGLAKGDFRATLLDVGQGQSLVLETAHHVAVLDTGPHWNARYTGASLAILPYLRYLGWQKVDLVVVSHSDLDHAGGTAQLVEKIPVAEMVSGQPVKVVQQAKLPLQQVKPCLAGQNWQWEGVTIEVLAPAKVWPFTSDNDRSCVVKISGKESSLLVMGDASVKVERWLIQHDSEEKLRADILVAGHHGSASSSSLAFLKKVQPDWVLFSSGYQNRFHFPSGEVLQRLTLLGIPWLNTAEAGAITVEFKDGELNFISQRQVEARWFR